MRRRASELAGFVCANFLTIMTMQLAAQNVGKIYFENAILTHLC